jgi:hypothetical protein
MSQALVKDYCHQRGRVIQGERAEIALSSFYTWGGNCLIDIRVGLLYKLMVSCTFILGVFKLLW